MSFHFEILTEHQQEVLQLLGPIATEKGFYLAGGTAVALLLGHRQSDDFDWFLEGDLPDPLGSPALILPRGMTRREQKEYEHVQAQGFEAHPEV